MRGTSILDRAVDVLRRNPIPLMLIATGVGLLARGMRKDNRRKNAFARIEEEAEEIPILNTGQTHIYDPDASPLHPTQDVLETSRETSARL